MPADEVNFPPILDPILVARYFYHSICCKSIHVHWQASIGKKFGIHLRKKMDASDGKGDIALVRMEVLAFIPVEVVEAKEGCDD